MPRHEFEQREHQPGRLRHAPAMLDCFLGGRLYFLRADRSSFAQVLGYRPLLPDPSAGISTTQVLGFQPGRNDKGQVGDGTTTTRLTPVDP